MPLVGLRNRSKLTIASAIALLFVVGSIVAACAGAADVPPLPPQPGNEQPPGFFPVDPVTQAGAATQSLYLITFVISVIVFFIVEGLLLFITIRFRRRRDQTELPYQRHGSNVLEVMWTIVPAITVTVLFVAALITLNEEYQPTAATPDLVVDVTGFQWQWTFDYEQEGLSFTGAGNTGPEMGLPINENVRIRLHGVDTDVIHSFYVPQFLFKMDVVPGRVNEFDVIVTKPGLYGGQCAEFCGIGHAEMQFTVNAMTRADFDAWVVEHQQAAPTAAPVPSGAPSISLSAVSTTAFDQDALSAPPDQPIVFNFTNADPGGQPHNVAIQEANPDGTDWLGMPFAEAGQTATYVSPPLPAKAYEFYCAVHPTTMRGTLTVSK